MSPARATELVEVARTDRPARPSAFPLPLGERHPVLAERVIQYGQDGQT